MNKKLIRLAQALGDLGYQRVSFRVMELAKFSSERDRRLMEAYEQRKLLNDLGGDNPYYDEEFDFDWILKGNIFRTVSNNNPGWFDNFINNNGDEIRRLVGSQTPKYLGSGVTGDAWLIGSGRDKRVLKLFDANSMVGGRDPVAENEELMKMLHTQPAESNGGERSSGLGSIPMIYESGVFGYSGDRADGGPGDPYFLGSHQTEFNTRGSFRPAYTVMEFTETMPSLASKHESMSGNEPQDIESLFKHIGIEEEAAAEWVKDFDARGWGLKSLMNYANRDFLINNINMDPQSADKVMEYIKSRVTRHKVDLLLSSLVFQIRLAVGSANPEDIKAEGDEKYLNKIREALKPYESEVNNMISGYGLPSDWLEDFIRSNLENIKLGRADLHSGNWGFRGDKVVFFDA